MTSSPPPAEIAPSGLLQYEPSALVVAPKASPGDGAGRHRPHTSFGATARYAIRARNLGVVRNVSPLATTRLRDRLSLEIDPRYVWSCPEELSARDRHQHEGQSHGAPAPRDEGAGHVGPPARGGPLPDRKTAPGTRSSPSMRSGAPPNQSSWPACLSSGARCSGAGALRSLVTATSSSAGPTGNRPSRLSALP